MEKSELISELTRKNELGHFYSLLSNKDFDEIYRVYGKRIYNFVTPVEHKRYDVTKLVNEGNLVELYSKYGKIDRFVLKKFGKCSALKGDSLKLEKEVPAKKKMSKGMKKVVAVAALIAASPVLLVNGVHLYNQSIVSHNEKVYANELQEYDEYVSEYASEIRNMNLTRIQTIAKVMDDTWKNIDGYGNPDYDIFGHQELDMYKGKKGQCRNIAKHVGIVLNEIDPSFNARDLYVYQDASAYGDNSVANIDRTFLNNQSKNLANKKYWDLTIETNPDLTNAFGIPTPVKFEKLTDQPINPYINVKMEVRTDKSIHELFGNHMVITVDIPEDNVTLVVDPTNPTIGVVKDGEIQMFTTNDGKGLEFSVGGEGLYNKWDDSISYYKACMNSYKCDKSFDELKETYDLNKALDEVRSMEHTR